MPSPPLPHILPANHSFSPLQVDIKESDTAFEIAADVPGVPKESIKVEMGANNTLHISADSSKASSEEGDRDGWKFHREERSSSHSSRAVRLPPSVDTKSISAKVDNGVLRVTMPKLAPLPEAPHGRTSIPIA